MLKLARKLKAKGYAAADIAEITGLLADEIEKLDNDKRREREIIGDCFKMGS